MSDPINLTLIGKYVGAFFLEALDVKSRAAAMLDIAEDHKRTPDNGRPVLFKSAIEFPPSRPVLAALYQLTDGRMQMQTVGRGVLGRGLWLNRRHSSWDFAETPLSLTMTTDAEGHFSLSYLDNGTSYDACAHRLYERVESILAPTWEAPPHATPLLRIRKREKFGVFQRTYKGPFPAPEVLRRGAETPGLDFADIFLVNVDLTGANLPKAVFKEVQFYNTTLKNATLTGANFKGCVLGRTGGPCSFEGANLTGANFDGANLTGANFKGANLTKATFVGATLAGVNFSGATLDGVNLTDHNLTGANLSGARLAEVLFLRTNLTRVNFTNTTLNGLSWAEHDLTGATLTGATLDRTDLRRALLRDVNLSGLDLRTTLLHGVRMPGANLSGTNLQGADLTDADLSEAAVPTTRPLTSRDVNKRTNFTGAKLRFAVLGLNWEFVDLTRVELFAVPLTDDGVRDLAELKAQSAILTHVDLNKADLTQAELMRAQLQNIVLTGATLNFANLTGAALKSADLTGASMMNADLTDTDLTHAEMAYVELHGDLAKVTGAIMELTNLTNAYLVGLDFGGIRGRAMQGCFFTGACLANTSFRQTIVSRFNDSRPTSMAGACLQGADFTGASLYGVKMANAAVAQQAGKLTVTIASGTMDLEYPPTKLDPGITDQHTTCPSNTVGPCTGTKMSSDKAPMHRWPGQPTPALLGLPDLTDDELLALATAAPAE